MEGDVVVLATGFHKPEIGFFEEELFPEDYDVRSVPDLPCRRSSRSTASQPACSAHLHLAWVYGTHA